MSNRHIGRVVRIKDLRNASPSQRGVAYANRLGFVHGLCGQTRAEDCEVLDHVLARLGLPVGGNRKASTLQSAGEAYGVGRLMGAEFLADMPDLAPEKRLAMANSLWPVRTILPQAFEARLESVVESFRPCSERMPDEFSERDEAFIY